MIITAKMKQWAREEFNLSSTFDDEAFFQKRITESLVDGKLSSDEYVTLSKEEKPTIKLTDAIRSLIISRSDIDTNCNDEQKLTATFFELKNKGLIQDNELELLVSTNTNKNGDNMSVKNPEANELFSGGGNVRVRDPSERFNSTKRVGKHVKTGEPVRDERGREVMELSELEMAKAGVFLKHRAARDGQSVTLEEHERSMLNEMFEKDAWCGKISGNYQTGIPGENVKALLNDGTSGGQEVVPEWFDDALIAFPLLYSELLPRIDLQPVPRGSSVEGASIDNPTVNWGTGEGTEMSLFDTASLIAAIDTSIFPVTVAIEIGRDFLSDSSVNVGQTLVSNISQRLLAELDNVIVNGNGTTQPQGIFNASGLTTVTAENGNTGPPTVADYEALLFAVGKQYRNPAMRPTFIANDVSYSRARGIAVGASDQRRVFGLNHSSYQLLENKYSIQNDISNEVIGFGALSKYRLYRRQGQQVNFTSEGKELTRKNLTLLTVRGRYGGKVVDANAFAKIVDAQS